MYVCVFSHTDAGRTHTLTTERHSGTQTQGLIFLESLFCLSSFKVWTYYYICTNVNIASIYHRLQIKIWKSPSQTDNILSDPSQNTSRLTNIWPEMHWLLFIYPPPSLLIVFCAVFVCLCTCQSMWLSTWAALLPLFTCTAEFLP